MSKQLDKPYTKDPYFKRWMSGLSDRTKQNYTDRIQNWITFIEMNLTQQVSKRMKDLTSQDLSERQFFEDKFRAYKEYLEKRGDLKPLSVRTELTAVASFFSRIGLPLNLKRGDWESTQQQQVIQRLKITRDDVKAMYAHANLRDRALLLVLAQSGFSEVDVSFFRIEELKGLYDNAENEHYFIEKPREKTNEVQATCFSYEAVHDIIAMLQERGNPESGFLFVSQTKGKGEQLEVRSINEAMKGLAQKTFSADKAKEFKTKSLRSFYNSALLRASVSPQELKDLMFGHGRQGARGHYDYDETTIKEAYAKAFEHISINGLQTRMDIKKVMNALKGVEDANLLFQNQLGSLQSELSKQKEIADVLSKENSELKTQIKPITRFVESFKHPEQLQQFIDLWMKSSGANFGSNGLFIKLDLPEGLQTKLNDLAEQTKESPLKILDKAFSMGLASIEKDCKEQKRIDDEFPELPTQGSKATVRKDHDSNEYTLLCGKKIIINDEQAEHFHDIPIDACIRGCPDKEIAGDVNNCPDYKAKADAQNYADDPTYQEYIKSQSQNAPSKKARLNQRKSGD